MDPRWVESYYRDEDEARWETDDADDDDDDDDVDEAVVEAQIGRLLPFMRADRVYEVTAVRRDEHEREREHEAAVQAARAQARAWQQQQQQQAHRAPAESEKRPELLTYPIRVQASLETDDCSVCLLRLISADAKTSSKPLVVVACGHVLHEACAEPVRGVRCPLCRRDSTKPPAPPPPPPASKRKRPAPACTPDTKRRRTTTTPRPT